ncbi:MAG: RNA polymerase sigma factor [Pseudohongiellaceae bacterium]
MGLINEDEALIAAALKGSAYAWEKLVKRYESRIFNYGVRITGNTSDAMDLTQEVFLGIYRNLHRFRGDAKFSSWIFRIAHNKAVDINRRKRLTTTLALTNNDEPDFLETVAGDNRYEPDKKLDDQQANSRVISMLARLSLEQRLVIELKVYQSLTFEEIADMQGVSANTAKTRFYTALKKLKTVSEENNVLS